MRVSICVSFVLALIVSCAAAEDDVMLSPVADETKLDKPQEAATMAATIVDTQMEKQTVDATARQDPAELQQQQQLLLQQQQIQQQLIVELQQHQLELQKKLEKQLPAPTGEETVDEPDSSENPEAVVIKTLNLAELLAHKFGTTERPARPHHHHHGDYDDYYWHKPRPIHPHPTYPHPHPTHPHPTHPHPTDSHPHPAHHSHPHPHPAHHSHPHPAHHSHPPPWYYSRPPYYGYDGSPYYYPGYYPYYGYGYGYGYPYGGGTPFELATPTNAQVSSQLRGPLTSAGAGATLPFRLMPAVLRISGSDVDSGDSAKSHISSDALHEAVAEAITQLD